MLKSWLIPTRDIFRKYDRYVLDVADDEKHRIFIDRDSTVLFVAHLDTIREPKIFKSNMKYIRGQGFDDRLGCVLAYDLSKELGADLLLTDHEESCQTTAKFHEVKDYNWIVGFDREGKDVVTYGLDSADFRQALSEFWEIGFGSYSDIGDLKTDACCFNLGIGHYDSHSKKSVIDIRQMEKQVIRFKNFYAVNKDIKYEKTKREYNLIDTLGDDTICEFCDVQYGRAIFDYIICPDCFYSMVQEYEYSDQNQKCWPLI